MKRILPALLALTLTLSGCAAMTNRDYLSIQPHKDSLTPGSGASGSRVENYAALGEAIHGMVKAGRDHGVLRLAGYVPRGGKEGDVEADLTDACAEVVQRDPLGAYAVDFIKHDKDYIVSYYEANIYITYRRTPEQLKNIVAVTGTGAVRSELREALSEFAAERVLRVSYFTEDEEAIRALVRQAYYSVPRFALGMPELEVNLYPDTPGYTGTQRIVEILLTYPQDVETLRTRSQALAARAEELSPNTSGLGKEAAARKIDYYLKQNVKLVPSGSTAYAALIDGAADSEGLALAFQLLAEEAGLESYVVSGAKEDGPRYWNIVALPDGEYRHVDVTAADGFALSDADLVALGYQWDRAAYRQCGVQPPAQEEPAPSESAGQ